MPGGSDVERERNMVTLNDYLYSGNTVLRILQRYIEDLRKESRVTHNEIDLAHSNFLLQIMELLEHNDFLTAQSQKIREFYKYMAREYPFLAFTFKGRIKSLIRAEEKFNGYIVEYIYDFYIRHGSYPPVAELKKKTALFPGSDCLPDRNFAAKMSSEGRRKPGGGRTEILISDRKCSSRVPGRSGLYGRIGLRCEGKQFFPSGCGSEAVLQGLHLRSYRFWLSVASHHFL